MSVPAGSRVWNINPLVLTVDDFLSAPECQILMDLARDGLKRATTSDHYTDRRVSDGRTNSTNRLRPDTFPQTLGFLMKVGALLRMPVPHAEPVSVLHYAEAQEFQPHFDAFPPELDGDELAAFEAAGGQRLFSTMVYLNTVEEGGGTAFPSLKIEVPPVPGRLLVFANTITASRQRSPLSLHAGLPVTAGEKWSAISWWRERPFVRGV